MVIDAVLRNLELVGEASNRFNKEFKDEKKKNRLPVARFELATSRVHLSDPFFQKDYESGAY